MQSIDIWDCLSRCTVIKECHKYWVTHQWGNLAAEHGSILPPGKKYNDMYVQIKVNLGDLLIVVLTSL